MVINHLTMRKESWDHLHQRMLIWMERIPVQSGRRKLSTGSSNFMTIDKNFKVALFFLFLFFVLSRPIILIYIIYVYITFDIYISYIIYNIYNMICIIYSIQKSINFSVKNSLQLLDLQYEFLQKSDHLQELFFINIFPLYMHIYTELRVLDEKCNE